MRLAGTYHPIPYLIERITDFLPGVTDVSAIWIDFDKQIYTTNEATPLKEFLKVKAQKLRNSPLNTEWATSIELFDERQSHKSQLSLEDEDALNVLKLYLPSAVDDFKDVILIAFPQNVFLKSLNMTFKGINTQEKHILSNLLSSIFSAEHQRVIEERQFLFSVENINRKKDQSIQQLTEDLKSTEQLYSSSISNIINEIKDGLEQELNKNFQIDKQVIYKLAKERLTIESIKSVIKNAVFLAYNLNVSERNISISTDHIQLDHLTNEKQKPTPSIVNNKKEKTAHLLDKYETAAEQAISNGLTVNGKNVAAQLNPPVTPPAITDAIKKNRSKIAYLLQQYPEKWTQIRKSIRPISILDQNNSQVNRVS